MCCSPEVVLEDVPEIHFVDEDGNAQYEGEFDIVGVNLRDWAYARSEVQFIVRRKDDAAT